MTVDMGIARPVGNCPDHIKASGAELSYYGIDTGNPHAVYFLEDNPQLIDWQPDKSNPLSIQEIDISRIAEAAMDRGRFPNGVNSEFVQIISRSELNFRVWERGSGETMACGTGATASVAAGNLSNRLDTEVLVHLKGGDLRIRYEKTTGRCLMSGPAVEVYSGTVELNLQ